jgi:hypothetical protein
MRRLPLAALALALASSPAASSAQDGAAGPVTPLGATFTATLGGGGEVGLSSGKAGVLEAEVAAGWELASLGLRPELAIAIGLAPDTNLALRPGVRWSVPESPLQLRVALDRSNAREGGFRWRWLLVGLAAEIRVTSLLGLYAEIDSGAPLSDRAGVPLLLRGGASFRF